MNLNSRKDISNEVASPILLAGWPGIGSVGVGAINYLRRHLGAEPFADVDMTEFFCHEEVVIKDGIAKLPEIPSHVFYYVPGKDLIIFESEYQVPGQGGISLMNSVLDLAQHMDVQVIYTAAALAVPMRHTEDVHVLGISNRELLRDQLISHGVEALEDGQISGLNGLLLGFADLKNISSACLLATMPHHVVTMPNPKASHEIVKVLCSILDLEVGMTEMDEAVDEMAKVLGKIENKIKSAFSTMESDGEGEESLEDLGVVDEDGVPQEVMARIERMFLQVNHASSPDQDMATRLKEELDKWNLYNLYEDRFLNLFRDTNDNT
ncbi:MAG: PAC2 family protein [Candidatus Latescibacterota bacterium]|nr:PAC2 family protein [Candidatus Latescibacterota bacterium]